MAIFYSGAYSDSEIFDIPASTSSKKRYQYCLFYALISDGGENMSDKFNAKSSIIMWGTANIFYLYEVILRVSPGVMTEELMRHYDITTGMLGVIISFFYYSYTALQVPCGLILDKMGPRNLIGCSVLLSSVGLILFAATDCIQIAQAGRFLIGAGAACAFISSLQIASAVFPVRYFALFAGITNMTGTLGALCGGFPIAKSVNLIGWRETLFLLAAAGLIITIAVFLFIPESIKIRGEDSESFRKILNKVIKNKQVKLAGLIGGFMYLPISVFSELWAIPFFMTKYGINNETASIATAILFAGFAVGSIPVAIIAKKVNGYVKTIRFSSLCVALLFIPLIYVESFHWSLVTVFFIGLLTAGEVLIFTCAKNNESPGNAGTAIALANGLVMLAGSVFQPALGILLDFFRNGKVAENGLPIYEISCYRKAIMTLPICLIIALLLSIFAKETVQIEKEKEENIF
jgi:predicted MFS family arabinose efflux permease